LRTTDITCLQEYIDNATQLYIPVCALFQVKHRNISPYALISFGLSKFLGRSSKPKKSCGRVWKRVCLMNAVATDTPVDTEICKLVHTPPVT